MRLFPLFLAVLLGVVAGAGHAAERDYREGQVWAYKHRPLEAASRLRIHKIEEVAPGATVYHISIIGLDIGGGGRFTEVQHLPVGRASLDASVTHLAPTAAAFPDFTEGYAQWREAKGGYFTIPVVEILAMLEQLSDQVQEQGGTLADPASE